METRITPKMTANNKVSGCILAASLCLAFTINPAFAGSIERISVDSGNIQLNYTNFFGQALSDNGRYVVFNANTTNGSSSQSNTYLRDRATGITELVSVANDGSTGANGGNIDVSNDGRYIAFTGSGLDGSIGFTDVYVRDRAMGTTELISVASNGNPGTINKSANDISISDDGRYVVFVSDAADIVSGDTNGMADVFVRDRVAPVSRNGSVSLAMARKPTEIAAAIIEGRILAQMGVMSSFAPPPVIW